MAAITFDGAAKCILVTFGPSETSASVDVGEDLYSRWKEWVILSDNAKYEAAFTVIGGEDKGGGKRVGSTFFLLNGWLICPVTTQPASVLEIVDEVLPEVAGQPISDYSMMAAGHRLSVERVVPLASETIEVGSAVLPSDVTDIANAVWAKDLP